MNIMPKNISVILSTLSIILSMKYLYNSFSFMNINDDEFFNNIVLVFSNISMSLVFITIFKESLYKSNFNIKNLLRFRLMLILIFLYTVFCFCFFMNHLLEFGFNRGESLAYQIISVILSIISISYIFYIFKRLSARINSMK